VSFITFPAVITFAAIILTASQHVSGVEDMHPVIKFVKNFLSLKAVQKSAMHFTTRSLPTKDVVGFAPNLKKRIHSSTRQSIIHSTGLTAQKIWNISCGLMS
jgi:hypothetical protein